MKETAQLVLPGDQSGVPKLCEKDLKEASIQCDRSKLWKRRSYRPSCSLTVKRPVLDCSPDDSFQYKPGVYTGRLFILANGGTASASEDLVGRHKDSKTATIIGERTTGSGCGYTNGGIPLKLAHSGIPISMSDCARFLRDGMNEVQGINPDVALPMQNLRSEKFTTALKDYLSKAVTEASK